KHDPQVLSVLPEINLLDARIAILLDRAQRGESTALLTRIEKAFDKLVEANDSGDEEATAAALAALGQTVRGTRTDREAWEEISEKIDQRDRLTKSENRRLRESAELVQMSIVLRLLGAVALSLRTHVADRAILQAVQDDLALLTGGAIDQLATAGGPA
ncbi:MAG TPA: hypothetical protein VK421_12810, partial [Pyrinomonadaceae bacterium]|nr:hypothetical protein [Pyrinomonadaceae bacterium]